MYFLESESISMRSRQITRLQIFKLGGQKAADAIARGLLYEGVRYVHSLYVTSR